MARFDLGLTDAEFGKLTPCLLELLFERKAARNKMEYVHAGIIASAVINFSQCAPDKKTTVLDFVPAAYLEDDESMETDLRKMTPEEQVAYVRNQFAKRIYSRK